MYEEMALIEDFFEVSKKICKQDSATWCTAFQIFIYLPVSYRQTYKKLTTYQPFNISTDNRWWKLSDFSLSNWSNTISINSFKTCWSIHVHLLTLPKPATYFKFYWNPCWHLICSTTETLYFQNLCWSNSSPVVDPLLLLNDETLQRCWLHVIAYDSAGWLTEFKSLTVFKIL